MCAKIQPYAAETDGPSGDVKGPMAHQSWNSSSFAGIFRFQQRGFDVARIGITNATSMEMESTRLLGKNNSTFETVKKEKQVLIYYDILIYIYIYICMYKRMRNYEKTFSAISNFQTNCCSNLYLKHGRINKRQLVNPFHQTQQGQPNAKPAEYPSWQYKFERKKSSGSMFNPIL